MEFLSLSRRCSSSQNIPQRWWTRRNVCRSQATTQLAPQSTLGSRWWSQGALVWPLAMSFLDAKSLLFPRHPRSTSNLIGPSPCKKHTNRKDKKTHAQTTDIWAIFFYFLVEHCSTNRRLRPWVQILLKPWIFFLARLGGGGGYLQLLKLQWPLHRSYLHEKFVFLYNSYYLHTSAIVKWCHNDVKLHH